MLKCGQRKLNASRNRASKLSDCYVCWQFHILLHFNMSQFLFFLFLADVRAIVLEHGNPSMKSQMKALAAAESKFLFMYITIFYF